MKSKLAMLFILAIVLPTLSGCSRVYCFDGIIVDGDGQPIGSAQIAIYPSDWDSSHDGRVNGKSKDDGTFAIGTGYGPGVEYFYLVVTSDGHKKHKQLILADEKNLRVVLEREKPSKSGR